MPTRKLGSERYGLDSKEEDGQLSLVIITSLLCSAGVHLKSFGGLAIVFPTRFPI